MSETVDDRATTPDRGDAGVAAEMRARPSRTHRVGVVLAAGRSERLAAVTGGGSKALVRVGGLTLVERAVRGLLAEGLERVVVVVGYQAGPVAAVVDRIAPGRVRAALAEDWELGNGASLAAAEPHVPRDELFVLVTTDHVFGEGALAALTTVDVPGVLVDHAPDPEAWAEGTRVRVHEDRAVELSKRLGDPSIDCGAFLLPASVFDAQRRVAETDASLAGAVSELARERALSAVPLPHGSWWQDVDTAQDLRRASRMLRGSLTKGGDGPVSRYVNRPVSTRLSMLLAHLPIHPDVVSLLALVVAFAGAWSLALGLGVLGAVLVQASSILDGVDGEIARLQVRASPAGALLDGVLDRVADAAIVGGLSIWAFEASSASTTAIVALTVAATTGSMLSMATKDRIAALGIPPAPERWIGFLLGGRDARLLIVSLAALLGSPVVALGAITATSAMSLAARLALTRSTLRGTWPGRR